MGLHDSGNGALQLPNPVDATGLGCGWDARNVAEGNSIAPQKTQA
jgi:hypothetical protein